ncbi:MAG: T9SS type A sorting domain-containing protein [Bacteroidota bacterium]
MRKILYTFCFIFLSHLVFSQPNFTANDVVPTYETPFRLSVNPNFNGNQWSDQKLADIAAGNTDLQVKGVGVNSFRVPLPENFLDYWGYDIRVDAFQHYTYVGVLDNTVFLEAPTDDHKDPISYCSGTTSVLFANMYEPIWDNGENGTPVNDDNYAALYIYKTVSLYKDHVKFWEIWNEPDLDNSGTGWMPKGMAGNWYDNVPDPCFIKIQAPVFHYIRLLRISYEVIKSVDPEAFVTVGGIGYESFLDVLLRFTDNPDGGTVSSEYPLRGGAYFDVLSYHVYPHLNGSMKFWDNSINGFVYDRHSDAALDGALNLKDGFENVLLDYGYDGQTYPKKLFILTETTVPRKAFSDWIGSDAAARNYAMKIQVGGYQKDIRQIALYQLADQNDFDAAESWLEMSGLYKKISDQQPYDVTPNPSGIGCRTTTKMLWGSKYDATLTAALNLPPTIRGGAFVNDQQQDTLFVLWAKTATDQSENASAVFSFPTAFKYDVVEKRAWDFSETAAVALMNPSEILLDGTPVFLKGKREETTTSTNHPKSHPKVTVHPNPFDDFFKLTIDVPESQSVRIELYDIHGAKLFEKTTASLPTGNQVLLIEESQHLAKGMYLGRLKMEGGEEVVFKLLKF